MDKSALFGLDRSSLSPASAGHFLTNQTLIAFQKMVLAANHDGINIAIASSYRSFERQAQIWNRKFRGESAVLNSDSQLISHWERLSDEERIRAILRWSALPGASRHHWGTDLDIYDPHLLPDGQALQLTPAEYDAHTGYFADLTKWLNKNMSSFGFFRPYAVDQGGVAPEPWHLSFEQEASQYELLLSIDSLQALLTKNPIEGQSKVLQLLPQIYDQFIINICRTNKI